MAEDEALDDVLDINLRPAADVAARFIIIAALLRRYSIDAVPSADDHGLVFDLREWLRAEGLWDQATPRERGYLLRAPGAIDDQLTGDLGTLSEDLTTLNWALSPDVALSEDPASDIVAIMDTVPGPWDKSEPWIASLSLRPEDIIAFMRERTEVWSWRLELEPIRRVATGRDLREMERAIREVTRDGIASGVLDSGKRGGFTVDKAPLTVVDHFGVEQLRALMEERLRVLNWICGFGADWDSVPLEV